jgi:hypothetical protein
MDLVTIAVSLSLVYFAIAALMWVSSKEEAEEIKRKKDLEIEQVKKRLKKLSEKAKRRRNR